MVAIAAECQSCGDEHPLGDREFDDGFPLTTTCPACGSPEYVTLVNGDASVDQERKMRDVLVEVDGVGGQTLENLVDHFQFYAELEGASVDELTEVELVGDATAERIVEAV